MPRCHPRAPGHRHARLRRAPTGALCIRVRGVWAPTGVKLGTSSVVAMVSFLLSACTPASGGGPDEVVLPTCNAVWCRVRRCRRTTSPVRSTPTGMRGRRSRRRVDRGRICTSSRCGSGVGLAVGSTSRMTRLRIRRIGRRGVGAGGIPRRTSIDRGRPESHAGPLPLAPAGRRLGSPDFPRMDHAPGICRGHKLGCSVPEPHPAALYGPPDRAAGCPHRASWLTLVMPGEDALSST